MAADEIEIREATREDADAICDVHVASWRVGYRHMFPPAKLDGDDFEATRRAQWRGWTIGELFDGRLFVAGVTGRVVGFVHAGTSDGDEQPPPGEVFGFYAHPDVWGTGVADRMMATGLAEIAERGHDRAVVWTLADAGRARRFYERSGFVATGASKDWSLSFDPTLTTIEVEYERPITAADARPDSV